MFKQILVLSILVVLVNSQHNDIRAIQNDNYVSMNRRQYAANIESYDLQMDGYKRNYAGQINTIYIQRDMLVDSLLQNDEYLNPLEILSPESNRCVTKYRSLIPTAAWVKTTVNNCASTATSQVNSQMNAPVNTKNTLSNYYANTYEKQLTSCNTTYANQGLNYTMCITSATSTSNTYTINNQKTFATQMDAAECNANAYLKKALDCHYLAQNRTTSLIAQANTLINACLQGVDVDCSRCKYDNYSCNNVYYLPKAQVSYTNLTMINPFLGRNETECLMLDVY